MPEGKAQVAIRRLPYLRTVIPANKPAIVSLLAMERDLRRRYLDRELDTNPETWLRYTETISAYEEEAERAWPQLQGQMFAAAN